MEDFMKVNKLNNVWRNLTITLDYILGLNLMDNQNQESIID